MNKTLYETDSLLWSEQQAELLRQKRASNALDWENLAEEIEDVGLSELRAVRSHLRQALLHDLKVTAWPLSRDVPHWQAESRTHRDEARDGYSASMEQRIDMEKVYRQARRGMPSTLDGVAPQPVPKTCPVTLEEILKEPEE